MSTRPAPIRQSELGFGNRATRAIWGVVYVCLFRPSPRPLHRWRNLLLRLFGAQLHPTARVYPRARIWLPANLVMEAHACIADDVDIYSVDTIRIGEASTVSQYCFLCTASHDFDDVRHPLTTAPISIGKHVWVAADVFVAPNVTIADGSVVCARSSVFQNINGWMVYAGTPARSIRPRKIGPADFAANHTSEATISGHSNMDQAGSLPDKDSTHTPHKEPSA